MEASRREEGINSLADLPELQAEVAKSAASGAQPDLIDMAANSPSQLRETWSEYQVNRARRAAEGKQPLTFSAYAKARQTGARGIHGERTDAFSRGPNEIMIAPPGRVNEGGIDSISYKELPTGGRIKLLDNKAVREGATVGKVSALQENLLPRPATATAAAKAGNLADAVEAAEQAAAQPEAPLVIKNVVVARLKAASAAVDQHVAAWEKANPGKSLSDRDLQVEIGTILDQHGIDRVVTTAGGGSKVKISASLRNQGFKQE